MRENMPWGVIGRVVDEFSSANRASSRTVIKTKVIEPTTTLVTVG